MKKIYGSASKIVFIMIATTVCAAFLLGILPVDQFIPLATGAFAFYFANKGEANTPNAGK